jgi:hypothetical protein
MSFMMQIDAARVARPLDLLAAEHARLSSPTPSIDFCCRVAGVPDSDEVIARRLRVAVSIVRGWREIGRRAMGRWTCR